MDTKNNNLQELESAITDPFYRQVISWYKEQPTSSHIIEKLIKLMEDKKHEIDKT